MGARRYRTAPLVFNSMSHSFSAPSLMKYRVEHLKRNSISTGNHILFSDQYQYLGNYPPTPPLSQQHVRGEAVAQILILILISFIIQTPKGFTDKKTSSLLINENGERFELNQTKWGERRVTCQQLTVKKGIMIVM